MCIAALTGIAPVLVAETSSASHRGGFLGYVFIANCKYNILGYMRSQWEHNTKDFQI